MWVLQRTTGSKCCTSKSQTRGERPDGRRLFLYTGESSGLLIGGGFASLATPGRMHAMAHGGKLAASSKRQAVSALRSVTPRSGTQYTCGLCSTWCLLFGLTVPPIVHCFGSILTHPLLLQSVCNSGLHVCDVFDLLLPSTIYE